MHVAACDMHRAESENLRSAQNENKHENGQDEPGGKEEK